MLWTEYDDTTLRLTYYLAGWMWFRKYQDSEDDNYLLDVLWVFKLRGSWWKWLTPDSTDGSHVASGQQSSVLTTWATTCPERVRKLWFAQLSPKSIDPRLYSITHASLACSLKTVKPFFICSNDFAPWWNTSTNWLEMYTLTTSKCWSHPQRNVKKQTKNNTPNTPASQPFSG